MKWISVCTFSLTLLSGCGTNEPSQMMSSKRESPLEKGMKYWQEFAPWCEGNPSKEDCDDGDTVLFNGLLCVAGYDYACTSVKNSQASNGRWWRSPRRRDGNLGKNKSFSRDMTMGVLLYLAKTKDRPAAKRWMNWIEQNRACSVEKPFNQGCLIRGTYRVCRDDEKMACSITPGLWGVIRRVWEHLDLELNKPMRRYYYADGDAFVLSAKHVEPGYQMHLHGVEVYLKKYMQQQRQFADEVAEILADRQGSNPFYRYLHYGESKDLTTRLLDLCPKRKDGNGFRKHQWAWERDTASEAWRESMGWDCLFLGKHLL